MKKKKNIAKIEEELETIKNILRLWIKNKYVTDSTWKAIYDRWFYLLKERNKLSMKYWVKYTPQFNKKWWQ